MRPFLFANWFGGLLLVSVTLSGQPVVTSVLNGAAVTPNLSPGAVFIVKGTGLSSAGFVQASPPSYPLTLNTVSIILASATGPSISVPMIYTYNVNGVNQLAALMPSNVAQTMYALSVQNGSSVSVGVPVMILARQPGIISADGSGKGDAQATLEGQLILQRKSAMGMIGTFDTRPAHPGERMDLWGTGLGGDPLSDQGGTGGDQTIAGQIRVLLNGIEIVPLYAGRSSGFPGLDQIVFNIPADVALSCSNIIQVRAGGFLSNTLSVATSAAGSSSCSNSSSNLPGCRPRANVSGSVNPSQAEIDEWVASGQLCQGSFAMARGTYYSAVSPFVPLKADLIQAGFERATGSDLRAHINAVRASPVVGMCAVTKTAVMPPLDLAYGHLDAGAALTVQGPAGLRTLARSVSSTGDVSYDLAPGDGKPVSWLDPGTYTFAGPGSASVGSFSASLTVPQEFVITNAEVLYFVDRSKSLTIRWTGGEKTGGLVIVGAANYDATGGQVLLECAADTGAQSLTISSSDLQKLPSSASVIPGTISITAANKSVRVPVSGLDYFSVDSMYIFGYPSFFF